MAGKPRYKNPEEMQRKIDEYFESIKGEILTDDEGKPVFTKSGEPCYIKPPRPPTVTGLALYLGFASRQALINYEGRSRGFYDTITRAKSRIEEYAETRLYDRDGQRGAEFNLRVNFGWNINTTERNRAPMEKLDALLEEFKNAVKSETD